MVILKRKLKKSKLTVFLGVLFLIFSGCEMNNTKNPRLSDNDLERFLNSNVDFANFIEHNNKTSTIGLDSKIKKLSPSEIEQFKTVFTKYDDYNNFISNANTDEVQLFENIISSASQRNYYLNKVTSSLNKFEYNRNKFIKIISTKVVVTKAGNNGKLEADCEEIRLTIYIQELNYHYNNGSSIEKADRAATIASSWAYVGCVMAQR